MTRSYWRYQDPLEADLLAAVSPDGLMAHARAIAAWERESGTPGEAQAYDHIERALKGYGYAVERRDIEALISLPLEGRVVLVDGAVVEGLTHAFSPSTDGLEAEVVDVGDGNPEDFARAGAAGKIALLDSLATPGKAWAAQEAGTVGQIFVNRDHLHNMIVTTIWGTPEPGTAWRIPRTPCLSVRRADGDRIRRLLREGRGRVRLHTRVRTGWTPIPHLTAHLDGAAEDRFVLFSGHVDGWHHGAMDNGTANATMLEVARLLAAQRGVLRRGLRLAFWSGHSHGRYAGSAWYADHAWSDLHRRCAVHLNIDSTGARGATDYSVLHATEEAQSFVEGLVHDVTGQTAQARRFPRAGDQSFWGIGIPSALMSLSGIPRQDTDLSRWMERLFGTAGFPWWWHTREDTIDKIDRDVLALDTRVYVAAALRLCAAPLLPLDHTRFARAILETVEELGRAPGQWDAGPALDAAGHLVERAGAFVRGVDAVAAGGHAEPARVERNPDYWGEKALLDRVVFKVVPEEGARMIALQTADADMVMFPSPAQLPTFRKDAKYTVHEAPGLRVVYIGFNTKLPPLDDVRVRQALLQAVDRKAIIDNIVEGLGVAPKSYLSPGVFGYKDMQFDQLFPFDRAKAKALLAQAGWTPGPDGILQKGGQKLTLNWIAQRGRYPKDGEITEAVQQMWKEVGVDAKVEFREWATVFNESRKPDWGRHNWTFGWATTNADADYSLFAQYHSSQLTPTGWNRTGYTNPKVDQLLEAARRSLNQTEREKLYGEVQDIMAKDTLWVPVYNTKEIVLTRSTVKGFVVHPVEYNLGLWKTWLDK